MREDLKNMLEAVKQLKAEYGYGVGTAQTYKYLKAMERTSTLRETVIKELKSLGCKTLPASNTELSNICVSARCNLEKMILMHGCPENIVQHWDQYPEERFAFGELEFDYKTFLVEFYKDIDRGSGKNQAFRDSLIFTGLAPQCADYPGEKLPPTLKQKGEPLKLKATQFEEDSENEVLDLDKWLRNEPNDTFGEIRQSQMTEEEEWELLGGPSIGDPINKLYRRAKNDRTLHKLETERAIALKHLLSQYDGESDPQEFIDKEIDSNTGIVDSDENPHIKVLYKLRATQEIPRYLARILKTNRRWLERVLTR